MENEAISPSNSDWIDLFGWATSGYDHGSVAYQPWSTSAIGSDYYAYGLANYDLYDSILIADWGYNAISNGGDEENRWRTLHGRDYGEWNYLFNVRSASTINETADARYIKAMVNGVYGVILFPDSYVHPDLAALPVHINDPEVFFGLNVYSGCDWAAMEMAGCVFLPAAGFRVETTASDMDHGCYCQLTISAVAMLVISFSVAKNSMPTIPIFAS